MKRLDMVNKMLLKTVGFYGLICAIFAVVIFIYGYFSEGARPILIVSLQVALVALLVALVGLFFDRQKLTALVSIILSFIPWLYLLFIFIFGEHQK
jgi:uncharacterized membrane protein